MRFQVTPCRARRGLTLQSCFFIGPSRPTRYKEGSLWSHQGTLKLQPSLVCSEVHGATVTLVEPSIPLSSAVMVVTPGLLGINRPLALGDELLMMCATFAFEEVQSTSDVTSSVLPSEKTAIAII